MFSASLCDFLSTTWLTVESPSCVSSDNLATCSGCHPAGLEGGAGLQLLPLNLIRKTRQLTEDGWRARLVAAEMLRQSYTKQCCSRGSCRVGFGVCFIADDINLL